MPRITKAQIVKREFSNKAERDMPDLSARLLSRTPIPLNSSWLLEAKRSSFYFDMPDWERSGTPPTFFFKVTVRRSGGLEIAEISG